MKIKDLQKISDKLKNILIDNKINDTNIFFSADKKELLSFKGLGEKTLEKLYLNIKEELRNG